MSAEIWTPNGKILSDIKKLLGPGDDYDAFDRDIVMHINAGFGRLCTLGVGPSSPFHIETGEETWSEFDTDVELYMLQRFFFLYIKPIFDPSANSVIMQTYKEELDKIEWLMQSVSEVGY